MLTIAGRFRTLKYLARLSRSIGPVYFTTGQSCVMSVTSLHSKTQMALSSLAENPLHIAQSVNTTAILQTRYVHEVLRR